MTVTLTSAPTWWDVYLGIATLPAAAFATLGMVFFLREAVKVVSGFYDRKH